MLPQATPANQALPVDFLHDEQEAPKAHEPTFVVQGNPTQQPNRLTPHHPLSDRIAQHLHRFRPVAVSFPVEQFQTLAVGTQFHHSLTVLQRVHDAFPHRNSTLQPTIVTMLEPVLADLKLGAGSCDLEVPLAILLTAENPEYLRLLLLRSGSHQGQQVLLISHFAIFSGSGNTWIVSLKRGDRFR
uniref:(northern house mosquito) hypothetical protein n=1 Tax=Culex pipiens TaxID=7175 RepID=A0A8D8IRB2_CULPI